MKAIALSILSLSFALLSACVPFNFSAMGGSKTASTKCPVSKAAVRISSEVESPKIPLRALQRDYEGCIGSLSLTGEVFSPNEPEGNPVEERAVSGFGKVKVFHFNTAEQLAANPTASDSYDYEEYRYAFRGLDGKIYSGSTPSLEEAIQIADQACVEAGSLPRD